MGYIASHHITFFTCIYINYLIYIHSVIHLSIHISRTHVLTLNYLSLSVDSSFHPSSFPRYPYHITSHHIIDSSIFHSHPHSHPYIRMYVYIFTFLFIRAFYLPCICICICICIEFRFYSLLSTLYSFTTLSRRLIRLKIQNLCCLFFDFFSFSICNYLYL